MFLLLIHFIGRLASIKIPAAFFYASTRMLLSALTAGLITIFLGPRFIKKLYELKMGQPMRLEDCPMLASLHEKKKETPTMGGVLILFAMLCSLFLWMDMYSSFTWLLFFATVSLGFVGGLDDYLKLKKRNSKGLKGSLKILLQTLFVGMIALYLYVPSITQKISSEEALKAPVAKEYVHEGAVIDTIDLSTQDYLRRYYLPFVKEPIFILAGASVVIGFFITWLAITGTSNAVNLTDGLDGLAAGHLIMASLVFGIFAFLSNHSEIAKYLNILYIEGSAEIAIYLFALAGASLGFLWYNAYPAQVFMGDTGSIALGGVLGLSAVLLRREGLLVLAGGVFVAETFSVIIQVLSYKLRHGKRVFLCSPLHHHFEYKGWPETKVVMRFWIVGFLLAMLALSSLKFQ